MGKYIELMVKPLSQWTEAPANGIVVTNPPYGERITTDDMEGLYNALGNKLKNVFKGYQAWIIGYRKEYFDAIGLAPSLKLPILNGSLECELREYIIFEGDLSTFRREGGSLHKEENQPTQRKTQRRESDVEWKAKARREGFGGRDARGKRPDRTAASKRSDRDASSKRRNAEKTSRTADRPFRRDDKPFDRRGPRTDRREDFARERELVSENPLAQRRNEHALKSIRLKTPSLPPQQGPTMRSRGWKKKED